eukprot:gene38397-46664_t
MMHYFRTPSSSPAAAAAASVEDAGSANPSGASASDGATSSEQLALTEGRLEELDSFIDPLNRDQCWLLRRVGAEGHVLVLRAFRNKACPSEAVVSVRRLVGLVAKDCVGIFAHTAGAWQAKYNCPLDAELMARVTEATYPAQAVSTISSGSSNNLAGLEGAGSGAAAAAGGLSLKLPPKSAEKKRKSIETPRKEMLVTPSKASQSLTTPSPQVIARKTPRLTPTPSASHSLYSTPRRASSPPSELGEYGAGAGLGEGGLGIAMQSPMYVQQIQERRPLVVPPLSVPPQQAMEKPAALVWHPTAMALRQHLNTMLSEYLNSPLPAAQTLMTAAIPQELSSTYADQQARYSVCVLLAHAQGLKSEVERLVAKLCGYDVLHGVVASKERGIMYDRSWMQEAASVLNRQEIVLREQTLPRLQTDLVAARNRDLIMSSLRAGARPTEQNVLRKVLGVFDEVLDISKSLVSQIDRYLQEFDALSADKISVAQGTTIVA